MKRIVIALLLVSSLLFGCATAPKPVDYPIYGSVDKAVVEVLADGNAKNVTILSFNDFHGTLAEEPKGKSPGIAKMATYILDARKADPNTIVVSAGDNYQGSALPAITKGKVVNEFYKLIGLAASAVGNHEFDWGPTYFDQWTADGGFPFLAANLYDKASGKPVLWAKPYQVVKVGGHTVAFIGLATQETLTKTKQEYIDALDFKSPVEAATIWVAELEKTVKPEVIIALTHIPSAAGKDAGTATGMAELNELEMLCRVDGIDAVVTGHSHNTVAGMLYGVPVVQGYYNGRTFGKLFIAFADDGSFKITPSVDEYFKVKDKIAENPDAKKILDDYTAKYGTELKNKVADISGGDLAHSNTANVTPMGKWTCDAMRSRYNVQVAFQNGGGLRKGFPAGVVTVGDFWELMPFDNYTITFEVSGAVLKQIVAHGLDSKDFGNGQFSGLKVVYNPAIADATKIVSLVLDDGTPVDDAKMYSCAMNDFQFGGGDKYTMVKPNAKKVVETFEPIREMLIEEAKKAGTIKVPSVDGIVTKQ